MRAAGRGRPLAAAAPAAPAPARAAPAGAGHARAPTPHARHAREAPPGHRAGTEVRVPDLCSGSELKPHERQTFICTCIENNSGHIDMALFPVVSALRLFALTVPVCRAE